MHLYNPYYQAKKRLGLKSTKTSKREQYEKFRKTKRWQKTRNRIIAKQKVCQDCGSDKNFNIHHLTYDRLGFEYDHHLVLLCYSCHMKRHRGKGERTTHQA